MISSSLVAFVVFIIFVVLLLLSNWPFSRSDQILDDWAKANNYQILSREHRGFRKGPFIWTLSHSQTVYYVVIRDVAGQERSGWVRCGNWLRGLVKNEVEVIWKN